MPSRFKTGFKKLKGNVTHFNSSCSRVQSSAAYISSVSIKRAVIMGQCFLIIISLCTILAARQGVNGRTRASVTDINTAKQSRHIETVDTIVIEAPKSEMQLAQEPEGEGHKKYPFLASIMKDGKQICAGALIDEVHVLSSGHCVPNITSEEVFRLQIGVGYQTFGDGAADELRPLEGPYYVRRVAKVIMDRSFYYQTLQTRNSLVIFQMAAPVSNNEWVEEVELPNPLPRVNGTTKVSRPIKSGKLAGWRKGFDKAGNDAYYLKGVTLRVHNEAECRKEYLNSNKMEDIFCASTALANSCAYAVGSPVTNKRQGRITIIGIRERDCIFPNVFTKVEYFLPWIRRNLRQHKL